MYNAEVNEEALSLTGGSAFFVWKTASGTHLPSNTPPGRMNRFSAYGCCERKGGAYADSKTRTVCTEYH